MSAGLLFVYGTLMRGFALHWLLDGRAEYAGRGHVEARLFDLGAYPGAVRDPRGIVSGEVYRIAEPALWTALDSAEGPQYHREEVTVRMRGWRRGRRIRVLVPGPAPRRPDSRR